MEIPLWVLICILVFSLIIFFLIFGPIFKRQHKFNKFKHKKVEEICKLLDEEKDPDKRFELLKELRIYLFASNKFWG